MLADPSRTGCRRRPRGTRRRATRRARRRRSRCPWSRTSTPRRWGWWCSPGWSRTGPCRRRPRWPARCRWERTRRPHVDAGAGLHGEGRRRVTVEPEICSVSARPVSTHRPDHSSRSTRLEREAERIDAERRVTGVPPLTSVWTYSFRRRRSSHPLAVGGHGHAADLPGHTRERGPQGPVAGLVGGELAVGARHQHRAVG